MNAVVAPTRVAIAMASPVSPDGAIVTTEMAALTLIASGLGFPEGPVIVSDGTILVAEIREGRITRILQNGVKQTVAVVGGGPNGLDLKKQDLIKAMRAGAGPDMPVIMRLSQWKQQDYSVRLAHTPTSMAEWLLPLVEAGADILHCSQHRIWEPEFPEIDGEHGLNFAGWAKKLTGAATISVGSVGLSGDAVGAFLGESSVPTGLEGVARQLDRDEFDLVAVGRALLADPDWA